MRNPIREQAGTVAGQVRALLDVGSAGGLGDGELLERFIARGGEPAEAAFAALVERHGPMVLRACRSILHDPHRAQDAFQATFLLLSRRAGSLWVRDSLGPWLHSVACRVASGARVAEGRRRALELRAAGRAWQAADEAGRDDLAPALHEEIERLPERLKAPVVLCYLEGLTHDQAADHLACPVGTVRSRLARGRDRLRRGLARRGFAPTTSADPQATPPAPLPPSMAILAIQAARLTSDRATVGPLARWLLSCSEGMLKTMSLHPLKSAAVLLIATGALAAGLGATSGQEPKTAAPAAVAPRDRSADDKRFEAIEQRLHDLELKLEQLAPVQRADAHAVRQFFDSMPRPPYDQNTLVKIRPRFDNALVVKVFVGTGSLVKKGDPLLIVKCAELGQAKNELRVRFVQWDHDSKYLAAREPLFKAKRITDLVWTDTVNDEKKSRLDYLVARERLSTYGMSDSAIDKLIEGMGYDGKKAVENRNNDEDITRMTVVSPIDGVVVERNVAENNFYDQKDALLIITPPKP